MLTEGELCGPLCAKKFGGGEFPDTSLHLPCISD